MVDAIIVVIVLLFGAVGYRSGLIRSVTGAVGFVVGVLLGVRLAVFAGTRIDQGPMRIFVVMLSLIACIAVFQAAGTWLGGRIGALLKLRTLQTADRVAGGVLSALMGVVLCWVVALPLAGSAFPVGGCSGEIIDVAARVRLGDARRRP